MSRPRILLAAEAGRDIGLGHLRRTLAVADALAKAGADCVVAPSDSVADAIVRERGHRTAAWPTGPETCPCEAFVLDGYRWDESLLEAYRGHAVRMVLDDMGERPVEAEIVLNHNIYGHLVDYSEYRAKTLLCGPDYALCAQAFAEAASLPRTGVPRVLVSFGGTDDGRYAAPIVERLGSRLPGWTVDVALMQIAEPHAQAIVGAGARLHRGKPLETFMRGARIYVGAAGATLIEASAAGVSMVLCALADNQRLNITHARRLGLPAFDDYDPYQLTDATVAVAEQPAQPRIVDGMGASRVADAILAQVSAIRRKTPR